MHFTNFDNNHSNTNANYPHYAHIRTNRGGYHTKHRGEIKTQMIKADIKHYLNCYFFLVTEKVNALIQGRQLRMVFINYLYT